MAESDGQRKSGDAIVFEGAEVDLSHSWDASKLFAEDLREGSSYELGTHVLTEAAIIEFARTWDPQYFHTDPSLAEPRFGGVIASGLHILGVFQLLAVPAIYDKWNAVAGRKMDNVRFLAPATAGMRLSAGAAIQRVELRRPTTARVTLSGWVNDESTATSILTLDVQTVVARRSHTGPR